MKNNGRPFTEDRGAVDAHERGRNYLSPLLIGCEYSDTNSNLSPVGEGYGNFSPQVLTFDDFAL